MLRPVRGPCSSQRLYAWVAVGRAPGVASMGFHMDSFETEACLRVALGAGWPARGPSVTKPSAKPIKRAGQFHGMATPKPKTPVRRTTARPRTPVRSAKPDGDTAVKAYIAALPGWKKAVAKRIDALIEREVPNVRRAVKWRVPFYGIEGQGWFVRFAAFSKHVNLRFFRGTSLKPVPPVGERERRGQSITI